MKLISILGTLCTAFILVNSADAQDFSNPWKLVAQWDNDILTGTDRGYTNGGRVALVRELDPEQKTHNSLQRTLYTISDVFSSGLWGNTRLPENSLRFSWGTGLTQLMYTPEDFNASTAPVGERPYAGWLGAEFSLNASDSDSVGGITLSIGTTGKYSFAEEIQEWVHINISNSPVFNGWDSQVPGEPTVNLNFDHKEKICFLESTKDWLIKFDGYYEAGAAIGNFRTNAYLGSLVRLGNSLPNTYATPRVQLGSYGQELFTPENSDTQFFSFYGFAGLRGTVVFHDITLDGPVFRDFDETVESEPFVAELIVGIAARIRRVDFSLSQTTRNDEFKGQRDNQRFGSIMLRVDFPF